MSNLQDGTRTTASASGRCTLPDGIVISESCPCYKCGYNLRTLTIGHKCPECGTTILSPEENRRIIRRRRNLPNVFLFRFLFVLFFGLAFAALIGDTLIVERHQRFCAAGSQSAQSVGEIALAAWPLVHFLAVLYLATVPPSVEALRTRGFLAGLKAQRARLLGALAFAVAYVISVMVSVASLNP